MGKDKIRRFKELETFSNVFQPSIDEVFGKDYYLKNKWAGKHFKNDYPIILELGCGKGEYTLGLAGIFPEKNFIGIDIKGARIWAGARLAQKEKITNVAFIRSHIEFIESFFGENEVDEIWLTFPDPQMKTQRNKKRLTAPRFMNTYRKILTQRRLVHLKTDSAVLYNYTLELVKANALPLVFATDDLYKNSEAGMVYGISTFYEEQFIEKGLNIHYLQFELPSDKVIKEPDAG